MKKAFKDWITNIVGIIIWGVASYVKFFTVTDVSFWEYVGYMAIGFSFLFVDSKVIREWIVKYINKKIA